MVHELEVALGPSYVVKKRIPEESREETSRKRRKGIREVKQKPKEGVPHQINSLSDQQTRDYLHALNFL